MTSPLAPARALVLALCLFPGLGCQTVSFEDEGESSSSSSAGDSEEDGSSSESSSGGEPIFGCDPTSFKPCPDGQKCTVLGTGSQPVYECVNDDGSKLAFEACTPEPSTGQDQCEPGFACIPSEPGGSEGQCLELCIDDNDCEAALCVAQVGQVIPICAPICDPLSPFCPEPQRCYRVDNAAFICRFSSDDDFGITAEPCDIETDSGCAQGFVCETGQIIPGCVEQSCCTALCDLSESDPCTAPMSCGELPLDPQPGLENVGACYVPQ